MGQIASEQFRRSAAYVDRILNGEKPGDFPVQAPTKYKLAINEKTAKALGLRIPSSLLATADEAATPLPAELPLLATSLGAFALLG